MRCGWVQFGAALLLATACIRPRPSEPPSPALREVAELARTRKSIRARTDAGSFELVAPPEFSPTLARWSSTSTTVRVVRGPDCRSPTCVEVRDGGVLRSAPVPYGGEHLRFSFWMKTDDVRRGPMPWSKSLAQVVVLRRDGEPLTHLDVGGTVGTTGWTRHEATLHFEEKQDVGELVFQLLLWDARGLARFSEPRLQVVPTPDDFVKVPPLSEVEEDEPFRWPMPALKPIDRDVDTGRLTVELRRDGLVARGSRSSGGSGASRGAPEISLRRRGRAGIDIDRGYMTRATWQELEPGRERPRRETWVEVFRGSPILSIFGRAWLSAERDASAEPEVFHRLELRGRFDEVLDFEGDRPRVRPIGPPSAEPLSIALEAATTTKPFVVLRESADDRGVVLYFPHAPEYRRWYIEDYLVEREVALQLELRVHASHVEVAVRRPPDPNAGAGPRRSFDLAVFLVPFRGGTRAALDELDVAAVDLLAPGPPLGPTVARGFWEPRMPTEPFAARRLRMARYYPTEFVSWFEGSDPALSYAHAGGFVWGNQTATNQGIPVDPLARPALLRDHAVRALVFFLENGAAKGAPPSQVMIRSWAARLDDPAQIRTCVFSAFWEYRLGEFRAWLGSPSLSGRERRAIHRELERARRVYDPASPSSWTRRISGEAVWFDYLDLPIHRENPWIVGAHAISTGNAGGFALLARDLGATEAEHFWRRLFVEGVEGLLLATARDEAWFVGEHDPNELRYSLAVGGPSRYHVHLTGAWIPRLIEHARVLAPERVPGLLALLRRLIQAKLLDEHPASRAHAQDVIRDTEAWLGERRPG